MPLSPVQKGAIGQFAFLATALATGKGQVEAYSPAVDNEGRDAEIRRHLKPALGISIQVKVTFSAIVEGGTAKYLSQRFALPKNRVQNDPRLWYFFAYYDANQLRLQDPTFLVPSHVFHKMGRSGYRKGGISFVIVASLAAESRDRWTPYRVAPKDLGKRLLEIVDETGRKPTRFVPQLLDDGVWLGRAVPRDVMSLRAASIGRKYDLIRNAVLGRDSLSAWYKGHLRLFSPFLLGTKAGDPHVLGYQFGGTSEQPLRPEGDPKNWRCLRLAELTSIKLLPGTWHAVQKGNNLQHCIDHVDVWAGSPHLAKDDLRRAA